MQSINVTEGTAISNRRALVHDLETNRLGLSNNTLAQALQTQTRQSQFGVLDLGNFIDVFESHGSDHFCTGVLSTTKSALARGYSGCLQ
jgi:hypothetical protein